MQAFEQHWCADFQINICLADKYFSENPHSASPQTDRRVAEIKIAKKGLSLLEKMDLVDLKSDNILSHLNETDLKKLNELLDKIRI